MNMSLLLGVLICLIEFGFWAGGHAVNSRSMTENALLAFAITSFVTLVTGGGITYWFTSPSPKRRWRSFCAGFVRAGIFAAVIMMMVFARNGKL